jgi:hypothetical protein
MKFTITNDFAIHAETWRLRWYFQPSMSMLALRKHKYTSDSFRCGYDLRRRNPNRVVRRRFWFGRDA